MSGPKKIPGSNPSSLETTLYNRYWVELQHLPSQQGVTFKAFLTQFEDQFSSDWTTEQVFGRMDPIRSFRGTQRMISLGFDVLAGDVDEAKWNLKNCSHLLSMLYPSYGEANINPGPDAPPPEDGSSAQFKATKNITDSNDSSSRSPNNAATILGAPLFRLKFANLIQSANADGKPVTSIDSGLIGSIDGLTYSPDVEQGFFDVGVGELYPQTIKLSFSFFVAHDHPLGWGKQGDKKEFRTDGNSFPYPDPKKA